MTKYLYLKFENAGLIEKNQCRHFVRSYDGRGNLEGSPTSKKTWSGYDLATPIPYNVLSGVLAVLCGEIPVPSKRNTLFKRIDILDEIAKKSYVKYDMKPILNDKGELTNGELFTFSKTHFKSHSKTKTTLTDCDGVDREYVGKYNWDYLKRSFINKSDFNKLTDFLTELIGENCLSLTFGDLYKKLTFIQKDEKNISKIKEFLENNKNIDKELKKPWETVLFGLDDKCDINTVYYGRTPLLLQKSVGKGIRISGHIICPIDDDRVIDALHENSGVARILEGGIVYIKSLTKEKPISHFEEKYEKIFSEKQMQIADTEEIN